MHLIFQKTESINNSFRAGCANTRNIGKQYQFTLYVGFQGAIISVDTSRQKYEKLVKIICHIELFEKFVLYTFSLVILCTSVLHKLLQIHVILSEVHMVSAS